MSKMGNGNICPIASNFSDIQMILCHYTILVAMTTYLYYISVSIRLMFQINFQTIVSLRFKASSNFENERQILSQIQDKRYDFHFLMVNFHFISSASTFLCLVFKFQLIFHKESTMCIINMSSNCSNFCSIVFASHFCVNCLHFESKPWLYPNIPSE